MAKKCDFCASQGPYGDCCGTIGGIDCQEAARLYAQYMTAQASSNNTKNINVNKNYKKR